MFSDHSTNVPQSVASCMFPGWWWSWGDCLFMMLGVSHAAAFKSVCVCNLMTLHSFNQRTGRCCIVADSCNKIDEALMIFLSSHLFPSFFVFSLDFAVSVVGRSLSNICVCQVSLLLWCVCDCVTCASWSSGRTTTLQEGNFLRLLVISLTS